MLTFSVPVPKAFTQVFIELSSLAKHFIFLKNPFNCFTFSGNLFLIIDYCRHGNLKDYLTNHRGSYVNKMNTFRGIFGKLNSERSSTSSQAEYALNVYPNIFLYLKSNLHQCRIEAIQQRHEEPIHSSPNVIVNPFEESYYKDLEYYYNIGVHAPADKDIIDTSDCNKQPDWSINYKADSKASSSSSNKVSTLDLISWAFQVARGMEFLASQKVKSRPVVSYYLTYHLYSLLSLERSCTEIWPHVTSF